MRKWIVIVLAELVFLLWGITGLFQESGVVYEVGPGQLILDEQEGEIVILTEELSLQAGVYEAVLVYAVQEDGVHDFGVFAEDDLAFRGLRSNEVTLFSDQKRVTCEFYLTDSCKQLQAYVAVEEGGSVAVDKIQIFGSSAGSRILIFWTILLSLLVNGTVWLYDQNVRGHFSKEKQIAIAGCVIMILLACLPLFVDYIISADAVVGNLAAIERVRNDLGSAWAEGNLLWMVPALLRKIGLSMNMSYRLCLWLVNVATVGVAFVSFYKCGWRGWSVLAGIALWTLNPYRITVLYEKADLLTAVWLVVVPVGVVFLWWLIRRLIRKHDGASDKLRVCAILIIVISMLGATYQTNRILVNGHPLWVYSMEDMVRADETGLTYLVEDTYGTK